jgi:hypothetical protein
LWTDVEYECREYDRRDAEDAETATEKKEKSKVSMAKKSDHPFSSLLCGFLCDLCVSAVELISSNE